MPHFRRSPLLIAPFALLATYVPAAGKQPVPIVFVMESGTGGLIVGASSGSKWIGWEKAKDHLKAGDRFRFITTPGSTSVKTVTKPVLSEASGAAYTVTVKRAGEKSPEIGLPLSVRWNVSPRPSTPLKRHDAALRKSVAEFLKLKGLPDAKVEIERALLCDLDGDGSKEAIIEAHSPKMRTQMQEGESAVEGQFSAVFLRQRNGKVNKVAGELNAKNGNSGGVNQIFELTHLLDLNGDGRMEIVVESTYYEGGGVEIHEWNRGKLKQVLEASDGL